MMTVTFIAGAEKAVYSVDSYYVHRGEDGYSVELIKGFGDSQQVEEEFIGLKDWEVAFVTNMAGKTIDRIGG